MKYTPSVRSNAYQYKFLELSVSNEVLAWINKSEDNIVYSEEFKDLNDEAIEYVIKFIINIATETQQEIIELMLQGKKQQEMAKQLKKNQSSINKAILGNNGLDRNGEIIYYGGIQNKFKRRIKEDKNIKIILRKMKEVLDNDEYLLLNL